MEVTQKALKLFRVADALWELSNEATDRADAKLYERVATKYFWQAVRLACRARVEAPSPAVTRGAQALHAARPIGEG